MSSPLETPRARALAAALRQARERARVSLRVLGKRLGVAHSQVSYWETGKALPDVEEVASFLTAIGMVGTEKDRILDLARHAGEPNWLTVGVPGVPQQLAGVVESERAASKIIEWSPMIIPGLLQTADFMRTLAQADGLKNQEIEARVMVRTNRREVITRREAPVKFEALIGITGLREQIADPMVTIEQLRYLTDMAMRPNITIRVMPLGIGWHPGFVGPFVLYDFLEAPPVVHFEHYSSGAFVPQAEDVAAYQRALTKMTAVAMSPHASVGLIAELADEMEHAK